MKRIVCVLLFLITIVFFVFPRSIAAQEIASPQASLSAQFVQPVERYFRGKVSEVVSTGQTEIAGYTNFNQKLKVQLQNGPQKGKIVDVDYGGVFNVSPQQKLQVGDAIVLTQTTQITGKTSYFVMDRYRLPAVTYIIVGFFLLIFLIGGKKGVNAFAGLIICVFVILKFIVPQILAGHDPLFISIAGSFIIMISTIFLAHGFSKKTGVALVSTFFTLMATGILAVLFVSLTRLSGLGTEDSYLLQFGPEGLNLQGLLLGGIIIGTLGVLDDITTAQSAAIFELARANKKFSMTELFSRGMNIGREHVASLVNTLVLAYAGASLSLFILFVLNPTNQPYWVILNSELIIEELVRTLAGSIGLTLAVPLTTILAAFVAFRVYNKPETKVIGRKFKSK